MNYRPNLKNPPTIHELRRAGCKVRVIHNNAPKMADIYRAAIEIGNLDLIPTRIGGYTQIDITTPAGNDFSGVAFRMKDDQYNRKLGNRIALGRALKLWAESLS